MLCPTLCDPMNCSTPGFPALHYLPEFVQTHTHWVSDAILPSLPLLSPSSLALNLSQHQCLFQWINSLHQVANIGASALASVLQMNIQGWFPLGLTTVISLLSEGLSRVFSRTTVQKHQFFDTAFFMIQLSHPYMTTGKTVAWTIWTFFGKVISLLFHMLSRIVIAFLPRSKLWQS